MNPQEHVELLQAEVKRLREALREIAEMSQYECDGGEPVAVAIKALEGQKL